jgi:cytochrome c oxidase subunit 2
MGVLTYKGATAKESLASEVIASVPQWIKDEHLPQNAVPGAKLFASSGCTACHTYDGTGSSNLGAPDLTDIGSKNLGINFQIRHLKDPAAVTPGSPMPKFASLGEANLRKLAIFLEASKGKK